MSRKQKLLALRDDRALLSVLETVEGRHVLWRELEDAGVYRSTFSPDPVTMAFNEGRRSRGNDLLGRINELAPVAYLTMLREHQPKARLPGEPAENEPDDEDETDG